MARKSATQPPPQAGPAQAPGAGTAPLSSVPAASAPRPAGIGPAGAATSAAASIVPGDLTPPAVFSAPLRSVAGAREYAHCDLCGQPLGRDVGQFHMVSPLTARRVSVCRTCRRAALSEGYRPRS
jgi:hypothetical protein